MQTKTSTEAGGRTHISFDAIPNQSEGGKTCLTIYPPGQFIDNEAFSVFVGGCGRGERDNIESAKKFLLELAKEECVDRIQAAKATMRHYESQLAILNVKGLTGEKTENN